MPSKIVFLRPKLGLDQNPITKHYYRRHRRQGIQGCYHCKKEKGYQNRAPSLLEPRCFSRVLEPRLEPLEPRLEHLRASVRAFQSLDYQGIKKHGNEKSMVMFGAKFG